MSRTEGPTPRAARAGPRRRTCRWLVLLAGFVLVAAPAGADPFADHVVAYQIGVGGGAGQDKMPAIVLGPPRGGGAFQGSTDTLSLGLGGWIILEFTAGWITDGPGPDFTVFENPFLVAGTVTGPPFAEPGTVSVSADGTDWHPFPCHLDMPPYYPGCAGVYPVFANADDPEAPSPFVACTVPIQALVGVPVSAFQAPMCAGGDSYDLADLGLSAVRFVRIDASQLQPGCCGTAGFDLDAIAAIHFVTSLGGSSTTTMPGATTTTSMTTPTSLTTSTTNPSMACVVSQLPRDSLAGVECALGALRRTVNEPPQPSCTCQRCSLEPGLDRLTGLVMQADAATEVKHCKRKLSQARRVAKALSARVASLNRRGCLAPPDRVASLDAEVVDLARRTTALFKSAFCGTR